MGTIGIYNISNITWWTIDDNEISTLRKNYDKKTLTLSKNKKAMKYQLWANVILEICHKGIGKVGQGGGLAFLDFLFSILYFVFSFFVFCILHFSILFVDGDSDDDKYQDYLGNGW